MNLTGTVLPQKENTTESETENKKVEKPKEKIFNEIMFGNIDQVIMTFSFKGHLKNTRYFYTHTHRVTFFSLSVTGFKPNLL